MRTIKLLLAYDGTDFRGWQRQAKGSSVQGALEEALSRIEGAPVAVAGAGRTDSGVHATGQVASAQVTLALDTAALQRALNATLPRAIRVLQVEEREAEFHARFSASSKTYEYRIVNGPVMSPFWQRYAWHVPFRLDHGRMTESARLLEGTHDFAAFRSTGTDVQTTVRRVLRSSLLCCPLDPGGGNGQWADPSRTGRAGSGTHLPTRGVPDVALSEGTLLVYRVSGTGFLRHMVRAIVGTLVEIGAGRAPVGHVAMLLEQGRRDDAGPTAPAAGLCLAGVDYDETPEAVAAQR